MSTLIALWSGLPPALQMVIKGLLVIAFLFPVGGAASLAERKVAAWVANRPGPSRALPVWFAWVPILGPFLQRLGVFHLMADGLKMFLTEDPLPGHVNKFYFTLAPLVGMVPALSTVCVVPFGGYLDEAGHLVPLMLANVDVGLLAVFAVSSMGVYSLILAGWATKRKIVIAPEQVQLLRDLLVKGLVGAQLYPQVHRNRSVSCKRLHSYYQWSPHLTELR